ncbi:MAG: hypothetical protein KME07_09560 [Pegethrix bostrychoides GSE-TBD4-15B]|jgi:hypothetical protein|uniref:Uncharacterized protein n=1 Tax=Pegethrix bostrychoides GSE-TBD4-15B TaxID=2839662 RepID=A0A951PAG3_9CYAN|nr:hypothetical protein [Pegethrix bostrychoides GSE-TBD4-15B]
MVDQAIYSRSVTVLKQFTSATRGDFQIVYEPGFTTPWDRLPINRYYGFITDLRVKVRVSSIPEKELPTFEVEQSRTERLTAVRDLEWAGHRYELGLYMQASGTGILHIASISLLNRQPYYHVNLLPYFTDNSLINLASDARILARIENAGYGFLAGLDEVVIFGSVKEEVTTLPEDARQISYCQSYSQTVGTSSIQLLPPNPNRLQATFVNHHPSNKIWLNYGNSATAGSGLALMPAGGSYEINLTNPYSGLISAVGSGSGTTVSYMECV